MYQIIPLFRYWIFLKHPKESFKTKFINVSLSWVSNPYARKCNLYLKKLNLKLIKYTRNQELRSCINNSRYLYSSSSYIELRLCCYTMTWELLGDIFLNWGCSSNLTGLARVFLRSLNNFLQRLFSWNSILHDLEVKNIMLTLQHKEFWTQSQK